MARPRRSLHRIRLLVVLVSSVVQLPALLLLSSYGRRLGLVGAALPYLVALALTIPYLVVMLRRPFSDEPKPRWLSTFVLWPFFAWWSTCAIYGVLGALAWTVTRIAGADASSPLFAAFALSALGGAWSVRRMPRLVELDVEVPGLPASFDGYRVGQISDIHCGSYTPKSRVDRWVAALNAARPDLIAVTGDLVSSGDRYIDDITASLSALDAPDGVFACMGNHDYFCDAERLVAGLREGGIQVLRNEGVALERDGGTVFVAGVEDTWTGRNDLVRTLAARTPGQPTLLLAHDPNVFVEATKAGVELQLSGHTHGGQLALPIAGGRFNLARLMTRYTHGLYRQDRSTLYVSRGAGTTGPPVRLFAPAELTILTLRTPNPA